MRTLAIITAKGSSSGIPGKNMAMVNGLPLIEYTLTAAINSKLINYILVASESDAILEYAAEQLVARHNGNWSTYYLPDYIATSWVQVDEAVLVAFRQAQYRMATEPPDTVIVLQPTSVLRTADHIDQALEFYDNINSAKKPFEKKDIVFSGFDPGWTYDVEMSDGGLATSWLVDPRTRLGRQDEDETGYVTENGAIYIIDVKQLAKNKSFRAKEMTPYYMDKYSSLEVDDPRDIAIAEALIQFGH